MGGNSENTGKYNICAAEVSTIQESIKKKILLFKP